MSEGFCLHHPYLSITNIAVVFQFASNNNCQLPLLVRKQKLHLNALDSVFGPYNLFQEGFYEFHRRRRNSAGNVPRRNFMVSNIISPVLLPIKSRIAVCFKCIYILPTGLLCIFLYLEGCSPQGKISRRPIYFAFASNRPIFAIFSIFLSEACLIIDF